MKFDEMGIFQRAGFVIHYASLMTDDGHTSALCFDVPRPISMRREDKETFSFLPRFVNCEECARRLKANPPSAAALAKREAGEAGNVADN